MNGRTERNSGDPSTTTHKAMLPDEGGAVRVPETQTVCVMIPAYNCEKWLPRCLRSVIEQTYRDLEVIVIDDGSTDGSAIIADDFAKLDPRIRFVSQSNAGVAAARNRALAMTASPLIMFLDSDDWLDTTAIEKSVDILMREDCDLVFFGRISTSLNEKSVVVHDSYPAFRVFQKGELLSEYLKGNVPVFLWAKLYKRVLFDGITFPSGRIFEDISVMHKVFAKTGKAAYLPERLHFRMHRPGSLSKTMLSCKKEKDNLMAFQDCLAFVHEQRHPLEICARAHVLRSALAVLTHNVMMPCLSPDEEKAVCALVRENADAAPLLPKRYRRLCDSVLDKKHYLRLYGFLRFLQQALKKHAAGIRLHFAKT